jgi:aminoglycoside phosphotransferase (APT) family kinase protein
MPRLLGSDRIRADLSYMYIEWVRSAQPWPWRNTGYSEALITRLAGVHSLRAESLKAAIPKWDYEADLLRSAQQTLEVYSDAALAGTAPGSRPMLRTLERVAATLPAMRVALHSAHPQAFLHGDVHAGNAVLHRDGEQPELILLDWGRARFGSPLEDIASWLQSLGYWEYEVRRRHDTLFRHYLEARNLPDRFTPELRNLYWFAASSNALAGALRYHLTVMGDPERTRHEQSASAGAVIDWLRIIRRADACWRN